jgi:hypothetical protein
MSSHAEEASATGRTNGRWVVSTATHLSWCKNFDLNCEAADAKIEQRPMKK